MSVLVKPSLPDPTDPTDYPDSDGKPMADNTKQYEWIVTIKGNLELQVKDDPAIFVAGNNLIYFRKGDPKKRIAPDVYVAIGRPKGHRGSYKIWLEGGVVPQVVFEVLSPKNSDREMRRKRGVYRYLGVEEYYVIDPDSAIPEIWLLQQGRYRRLKLRAIPAFRSPRLGFRFDIDGPEPVLYRGTGERFLSFAELGSYAEEQVKELKRVRLRATRAEKQAEQERQKAEQERQKAEQERQKATEQKAIVEKLAAKLRELGINPDDLR
jgi:Uma2 family endonuclease